MNLLKKNFDKKDEAIKSPDDFWNWFKSNEKNFFNAVNKQDNIENDFFDKLSPKLDELKDGFYYVTGMLDTNTVELIFTADGAINNIAFIEDLVDAAPLIANWKFTALKPPALDIKDISVSMAGYEFNSRNMFFYADEFEDYPDEIDIKIIHNNYNESNKEPITNGSYIFLDNFLGELNFATTVDNLTVIGKDTAAKELIPIEKLKSYLIWREKEFIEKYKELRHDTENDRYSSLEATLKNGYPVLAIINTNLLNWDSKASHPWILHIEIKYDGANNSGMPDNETYRLLNEIEDELMLQLKGHDGYLKIGRQTANNTREIYFACCDFRKPSKVIYRVQQKYASTLNLSYDIYKDKYWQSFNRFVN